MIYMTSPRSGFRRAAVASWTLAGLGVAGVAGASALAYAETYKPPVVEATAPDAVEPALVDAPVNLPPAPPVVLPPPDRGRPAARAGAGRDRGARADLHAQVHPRADLHPEVHPGARRPAGAGAAGARSAGAVQAPKSSSSFPVRTSHVPAGGGQTSGGNSFSPHVTISRGS